MAEYRAAVVTVSDRASRGEYEDRSGPRVAELLEQLGFAVVETSVVADGLASVSGALRDLVGRVDLVVTTGGTGFSPRDVTPEATAAVVERPAPGLSEAMRAATFGVIPHGMLSRGISGIAARTLIVNLPGSVKGAEEGLEVIAPALGHGIGLLVTPESDHH